MSATPYALPEDVRRFFRMRVGADLPDQWSKVALPLSEARKQEILTVLDQFGQKLGAHAQRRTFVQRELSAAYQTHDWSKVDRLLERVK